MQWRAPALIYDITHVDLTRFMRVATTGAQVHKQWSQVAYAIQWATLAEKFTTLQL